MNILIDQLNGMLNDWKAQFDVFSAVQLSFTEDMIGQLCFNNKPLCLIHDLVLESALFTAEQITFQFSDQRQLQLLLSWPEEEPPYVASVFAGYSWGM